MSSLDVEMSRKKCEKLTPLCIILTSRCVGSDRGAGKKLKTTCLSHDDVCKLTHLSHPVSLSLPLSPSHPPSLSYFPILPTTIPRPSIFTLLFINPSSPPPLLLFLSRKFYGFFLFSIFYFVLLFFISFHSSPRLPVVAVLPPQGVNYNTSLSLSLSFPPSPSY